MSPLPILPNTTEFTEEPGNGLHRAFDLLRIIPKLHASLASEIIVLRRELESTSQLAENLKTSLATAKQENESPRQQLSASAKEGLTVKHQIQQLQNSMYEMFEAVAKGKDTKSATTEEISGQLQSPATAGGYSSPDVRGIDSDEESGVGNFEYSDDALKHPANVERMRRDINLQQGSLTSDTALKAKLILGLVENTARLARLREFVTRSSEESIAARFMHKIATPAADPLIPAIPAVASSINIESVQSPETGSRDPSTPTLAMMNTAVPVSVLFTKVLSTSSSSPSPTLKSLADTPSPQLSRDSNIKGFRAKHLKAIHLPKPVLAPAVAMNDVHVEKSHGPLNRPPQFGVTQQNQKKGQLPGDE